MTRLSAACLAALLRMEGRGVRVAARPVADDAGRLELLVFDDIIVTVSASPNGRALRVTTPTGNPPRGNRQARTHRYRLVRDVDGKEVLSIDVVLTPELRAEDVVDAVRMLSYSAFELRTAAVDEVEVDVEERSSTRSWPASGSHGSRGVWDPRATDAPHDCVSRPAVKDARLARAVV